MTKSQPTLFKQRYVVVMLFFLGLFFVLGAMNELVANLAPHLMPTVIQMSLEQSGYKLLHAHPVVHYWVLFHNGINLVVGAVLLVTSISLGSRKPWSWKPTIFCLVYVLIAGAIGSVVIIVFLFPVLDTIETLPVSAVGMKTSMIAGPLALMFVAGTKLRFLLRWREYYRRS